MEAVINAHERWWRGELDHPLVKAAGYGAYPRSHVTQAPLPDQSNCHDFFWTAGQIIDDALTNGDEALRPHFGPPPFICMGVSPENRDKAMKTIEIK